MVSDQFDHELQQLILAINKVSGSQKWRACAGAGAGKKNNTPRSRDGDACRVGADGVGSAGGRDWTGLNLGGGAGQGRRAP